MAAVSVTRGKIREMMVAEGGKIREVVVAERGKMKEVVVAKRGKMREVMVAERGKMGEVTVAERWKIREVVDAGRGKIREMMVAEGGKMREVIVARRGKRLAAARVMRQKAGQSLLASTMPLGLLGNMEGNTIPFHIITHTPKGPRIPPPIATHLSQSGNAYDPPPPPPPPALRIKIYFLNNKRLGTTQQKLPPLLPTVLNMYPPN